MPENGTPASAGADQTEGSQEPDQGTPDQPFLKTQTSTYKTENDVVKALDNSQKELQKLQTEMAELKRQGNQSDVLGKLSESIDKLSSSHDDSDKRHEEWLNQQREQLAENPGMAVDLLQAVDKDYSGRLSQMEQLVKAAQERAEKIETALEQERQARAEQAILSNPVYQQHRDAVEAAMEKYEVDQAKAIRIVADQVGSMQSVDSPPGTTGTPIASSGSSRKSALSPELAAQLQAAFADEPLSEDEIKRLAAV